LYDFNKNLSRMQDFSASFKTVAVNAQKPGKIDRSLMRLKLHRRHFLLSCPLSTGRRYYLSLPTLFTE
jgi:hypothetical protein